MCFNNAPMQREDLIETAIHGFAELSEAVNQRGLKFLHQNTAISRKLVGKNVHATTPKGNMGYDKKYTLPNDCSCRT